MGIRKGTKLSDEHRRAISEGIRRAVDKGWKPNSTSWPLGLAAITPEARKRGAKKAGKSMEGRPQRLDTVCGKHSDHKNAKWWKFENKALGKVLEGKNLNQLVRDNEDLFDQEDMKWDRCGCKASRCLRTLKSPGKKRTRNSWKGWMICTPNV